MKNINKRHLAKAVTWRFVGTIDTFILGWVFTENINHGISLSAITTLSKLILYFFHEKFWFKSALKDSQKRHIIKTFSWRIIGTIDTYIFGFLLIGNPLIGLKIGLFETISKMILYYFHEKIWYKFNFGLNTENRS